VTRYEDQIMHGSPQREGLHKLIDVLRMPENIAAEQRVRRNGLPLSVLLE
jgi:hypothetical protein